jgi:hypothetical protein
MQQSMIDEGVPDIRAGPIERRRQRLSRQTANQQRNQK